MNIIEHNKNGLVYLTADGFEAAGGVAHGFSTRLGGVSEGIYATLNLGMNRGDAPDRVRENYRRFCAAIGADMGNIVCASQVHGDTVRTVTAADLGIGLDEPEPWQADGLVTDIPGVTLAVFSADCLPILLYDPVRRVVGAVHAGWRGTALGIVAKAVERMVDCYGCDRLDILAAIGPGISKCCFETHEDVPNAMTEAMGAAALPFIEVLPTGKFHVDLKGLNARRLEGAGLSPEHIAVSPDCTACLPDKYWSHRCDPRGAGEPGGDDRALASLGGFPLRYAVPRRPMGAHNANLPSPHGGRPWPPRPRVSVCCAGHVLLRTSFQFFSRGGEDVEAAGQPAPVIRPSPERRSSRLKRILTALLYGSCLLYRTGGCARRRREPPPPPHPRHPRAGASPEFALACYPEAGFHPITGSNRTNLSLGEACFI